MNLYNFIVLRSVALPSVHSVRICVKLNLFNSVFVRNRAGGDGYVDIRNSSNYDQQLTVKNSIIGLIQGGTITAQDNSDIPTKSMINTYKFLPTDEYSPVAEADPFEVSGIDFDRGLRFGAVGGSRMPYYLLVDGSPITKLGDPALLADYDTMDDIFGRTRTEAADGSISAAPTLASTPDGFSDRNWRDNILPTGINSTQVENGLIGATISGGILAVNFGELRGLTKGTLFNISGQEVEQVFNCMVVGKGFYSTNAATGMYILKVENAGKTYTQKLIVTK